MKDVKISTEDIKKWRVGCFGNPKSSKIYQDEQKIGRYELFSKAQAEKNKFAVVYQRQYPHLSYRVAYEAIKMQNVLNRIKAETPDDFTSEAIFTIGALKIERFLNFSLGLKIFLTFWLHSFLLHSLSNSSRTLQSYLHSRWSKKGDPPKRANPLKMSPFFDFTGLLISWNTS